MKKTNFLLSALGVIFLLSCSSDDNSDTGVVTSEMAYLFATTHNGDVKRYDINTGTITTYANSSSDSEGIYYSDVDDSFTIVSRSSGRLESYLNISELGSGETVNPENSIVGSPDLESPRDLTVNGDYYVVSDNTDLDGDETTPEGRLFIYIRTATGFVLRNIVQTKFKVWGIEFVGEDLFAVVDETSRLAVYRDFLNSNRINQVVTANKIIAIQGIVRAHGLDYDGGNMILSDIGEAESSSDGALHVIENFDQKFSNTDNGGFIGAEDQLRISGNNTLLGNPVNVVYDSAYNVIFVAEVLNNNGRILAFNNATSVSGNISPDLTYALQEVSSVFFHTE
ncbi:hypothetical protein ML462_14695 [Gramella lutea]|uniref:Lipoprotein n=1 Tax=Christiangramia lutea TaxID=1607951 RepID=A0A9X1V570_9FLAO|nr:hypothetical protein [Christiangramia lutea]MCH4824419.1 hypothetical protein [Christiangramia lutea]